jgi:4-hydroxy-tetrahydrodipicolinate reductase
MHIFVNGLSGKMGTSISHRANKAKNIFIIDSIKDCDAVIDFSRPESTMEIINQCKKHNKPIVIGTTGFNHEQLEEINNASKVIPILLSYNMSKGIFFLKESIKDFIKKNDNSFECIIKEVHHKEKVDSPSGTAIELKELIENNDRSNIISSIIIESRRVEDINGIHEVRFFNEKDSITFKHEALSRNIFSDGALFIANSITKKSPNLYSIKDFFS